MRLPQGKKKKPLVKAVFSLFCVVRPESQNYSVMNPAALE